MNGGVFCDVFLECKIMERQYILLLYHYTVMGVICKGTKKVPCKLYTRLLLVCILCTID